MNRRLGWLLLYLALGVSVFIAATWLLPRVDAARRNAFPRIRVSPPQHHESHPSPSADLDRG